MKIACGGQRRSIVLSIKSSSEIVLPGVEAGETGGNRNRLFLIDWYSLKEQYRILGMAERRRTVYQGAVAVRQYSDDN